MVDTSVKFKIYSEDGSYGVGVQDDSDSIGCVEITVMDIDDDKFKIASSITPEMARDLAKRINYVCDVIEEREAKED